MAEETFPPVRGSARRRRVEADEGDLRLDRWFARHYPGVPHGMLRRLLRIGAIRVDGRRAQASQRLKASQEVRLPSRLDDPPPEREPPRRWTRAQIEALKKAILHEDEDLWVLNKPDGLAVQGGSRVRVSVDGMMLAWAGGAVQPKLVHRLDRQTSGVLIVAKNAFAAAALAGSFRRRQAVKVYWALSLGAPSPAEGLCDLPLRPRSRGGERRMEAAGEGTPSLAAVTRYRTLARHRPYAWMALFPLSGRMHQLRVHCAALGAPICGDEKYGGVCDLEKGLYLHARSIDIPHPRGGRLRVQAPLPPHMERAWRRLGFSAASSDSFPRESRKPGNSRPGK